MKKEYLAKRWTSSAKKAISVTLYIWRNKLIGKVELVIKYYTVELYRRNLGRRRST